MPLREAAQRHHDVLFPSHVSRLKETDPELVEIWGDWAFGDVLEDETLDARTRLMVQLAAIIASHAVAEYRVMLDGALNVGVTPIEVKEIVYQAVPYVGMAKVFDFLHATNDVLRERGVSLPLASQSTTTRQTRREMGIAVQKAIFGDEHVERLRAKAPVDQRHIQEFLSTNCFGDHLTRAGIDLKLRELLTLSMLAALGGCEPQLAAHVSGNVNVGNDRRVLIATVTQLLPFIGYPRALNALRVIDDVTSR
jgi:4-carboxymuconolactone decarboxylase